MRMVRDSLNKKVMWEIKENKKDRIYMWWGNLAIQKR